MAELELEIGGRCYALVRGARSGLDPELAAAQLRLALARSTLDPCLRDRIVRWVRRTAPVLEARGDGAILDGLLRDVCAGIVRVRAREPGLARVFSHRRPRRAAPPKVPSEAQPTWFEAVIEDHDGRALAQLDVRVTLADGSSIDTRTDDGGRVYIEPVPPGECRVNFELPLVPRDA